MPDGDAGSAPGREEFLICCLARMMRGMRSVAVGARSPVPGAAALLAQAESGGRTTAMVLGSSRHGPFHDAEPQGFDRTMAELAADEKNRISHRGFASRRMRTFLARYLVERGAESAVR